MEQVVEGDHGRDWRKAAVGYEKRLTQTQNTEKHRNYRIASRCLKWAILDWVERVFCGWGPLCHKKLYRCRENNYAAQVNNAANPESKSPPENLPKFKINPDVWVKGPSDSEGVCLWSSEAHTFFYGALGAIKKYFLSRSFHATVALRPINT